MSAPFIIPFDNNPASIVHGTTASYTVPAGKFAKLTISYDQSFTRARSGIATIFGSTSGSQAEPLTPSGNGISGELTLWLGVGDTVALSASNTTGTATAAATTGAVQISITGIAGVNINLNGTLWKVIQSRMSLNGTAYNANAGSITYTITPTSNFGWVAQEYNVIS